MSYRQLLHTSVLLLVTLHARQTIAASKCEDLREHTIEAYECFLKQYKDYRNETLRESDAAITAARLGRLAQQATRYSDTADHTVGGSTEKWIIRAHHWYTRFLDMGDTLTATTAARTAGRCSKGGEELKSILPVQYSSAEKPSTDSFKGSDFCSKKEDREELTREEWSLCACWNLGELSKQLFLIVFDGSSTSKIKSVTIGDAPSWDFEPLSVYVAHSAIEPGKEPPVELLVQLDEGGRTREERQSLVRQKATEITRINLDPVTITLGNLPIGAKVTVTDALRELSTCINKERGDQCLNMSVNAAVGRELTVAIRHPIFEPWRLRIPGMIGGSRIDLSKRIEMSPDLKHWALVRFDLRQPKDIEGMLEAEPRLRGLTVKLGDLDFQVVVPGEPYKVRMSAPGYRPCQTDKYEFSAGSKTRFEASLIRDSNLLTWLGYSLGGAVFLGGASLGLYARSERDDFDGTPEGKNPKTINRLNLIADATMATGLGIAIATTVRLLFYKSACVPRSE